MTLVVALVLEIIDITIVNTALPSIKAEIGASASAAQWVVVGYSLAFALLLMVGGALGDSFGYRRLFMLGVGGFTIASVACGLAQSPGQLIAARLMQGATGALMAPQSMALMQLLFSPIERVSKLAMFGVIGGIAAIAGPIIGGLLIEADLFGLGWRLIFLINLPVGIAAVVAAARFLPIAKSARPAGHDFGGTLLFGCAIGTILWPLISAEGQTHADIGLYSIMPLALPLTWIGVRHVRRRVKMGHPALFDPAIFDIPTYRLGLGMAISFGAAGSGFLLIFAFALQVVRGESALTTGLLHVPYGLGTMFGIAFLSRSLLPRLGRWLPFAGSLVMAASVTICLLAVENSQVPLWHLAISMLVAGIGMGMTAGCIGPITFSQMDREHAGSASGVMKTAQQLGAALGVALTGSAFFIWASKLAWSGAFAAAAVTLAMLLICGSCAFLLPPQIFGSSRTS